MPLAGIGEPTLLEMRRERTPIASPSADTEYFPIAVHRCGLPPPGALQHNAVDIAVLALNRAIEPGFDRNFLFSFDGRRYSMPTAAQ
ncbi:hypothetical protein AYJ54_37620 [Bradyrhizobium centrolobii]|uniref:Uncharacterized protein n=1 Tax=Bradyrhizobium centrolobii TaxID=1505087 RepID=A0A176ZAR0_9BRAD|nr:hypothetical protein AYJ54_37620 [Bradyrhizobium centrolobii]